MSIGMSDAELIANFFDNLLRNRKQVRANMYQAIVTNNTEVKELVESMRASGNITLDQINEGFAFILAFTDTIAANNERLAKSIAHVEP